jgi:hypothetical protein
MANALRVVDACPEAIEYVEAARRLERFARQSGATV